MNFVRFYTILLTLIGVTMTLLLAVVCLLYAIYIDASPKMREEWPTLLIATGMFGTLTVAAGGAFVGLRKQARWLWPAQAVLIVVAAVIAVILKNFLLG